MTPLFSHYYDNVVFETYEAKPELSNLMELTQVHSDKIVTTNKPPLEADGWLVHLNELQNLIPVIKTADCLPIWIISGNNHYLIHAGWRGLQQNILKSIESIDYAVIGPSIRKENFEVQDDFRVQFHKLGDKLTFDLQGHAIQLIKDISPNALIIGSQICTFENLSFHSYRRDKTKLRNWSIIRSLG